MRRQRITSALAIYILLSSFDVVVIFTMQNLRDIIKWGPAASALVFIGSLTSDFGYFSVFGHKFMRFSTISDYISNFISNIPPLIILALIVIFFLIEIIYYLPPSGVSLSRYAKYALPRSFFIFVLAIFTVLSVPAQAIIYQVIWSILFISWIGIGPVACNHLLFERRSSIIVFLSVFYLFLCFWIGTVLGSIEYISRTPNDSIHLRDGVIIRGSILKSYDRGALIFRHDTRKIELVPWDLVSSISDTSPKNDVSLFCRTFGCSGKLGNLARRDE